MTALAAHLRQAMVRLSSESRAGLLRTRLLHWRKWAVRAVMLRTVVAQRLVLRYQGAVLQAWWARLTHAKAKRVNTASAESFFARTAQATVLNPPFFLLNKHSVLLL